MSFLWSRKVRFMLISFAIAFVVVMGLFIIRPDIVKSKNKFVRGFFAFALVFIPGVFAASVCAATITLTYKKLFKKCENKGECSNDTH